MNGRRARELRKLALAKHPEVDGRRKFYRRLKKDHHRAT